MKEWMKDLDNEEDEDDVREEGLEEFDDLFKGYLDHY